MLSGDPAYADKAKRVSDITQDISEYLTGIGVEDAKAPEPMRVAYHSACSLQHGQRVKTEPKTLLANAGFEVAEPAESHLCCGSAGTYNLEQPEIAAQLGQRKAQAIIDTDADLVVMGNIGCFTQIENHLAQMGKQIPVMHTVQLLANAYK